MLDIWKKAIYYPEKQQKLYKKINSQKYMGALLCKARVEKIFLWIQYLYTMLELAEYFIKWYIF